MTGQDDVRPARGILAPAGRVIAHARTLARAWSRARRLTWRNEISFGGGPFSLVEEYEFEATGPGARALSEAAVDLYWLPLGAGGHSVRWNGRIFEWVVARIERRERCDLYHSALEVRLPEGRFVVEQAPAWRESSERGVVAEGAVGSRAAGRLRLFRYEIRRWRDGIIPDLDEAVASPRRLSTDPDRARSLLDLVPQVPTPVWARDELGAGEMWNSNSTISWLITRSGLDVDAVRLPPAGRAPGWHAGIIVARRQEAREGRRESAQRPATRTRSAPA